MASAGGGKRAGGQRGLRRRLRRDVGGEKEGRGGVEFVDSGVTLLRQPPPPSPPRLLPTLPQCRSGSAAADDDSHHTPSGWCRFPLPDFNVGPTPPPRRLLPKLSQCPTPVASAAAAVTARGEGTAGGMWGISREDSPSQHVTGVAGGGVLLALGPLAPYSIRVLPQ